MVCEACGASLQDGLQVCGQCGKRQEYSDFAVANPMLRRAALFLEDEDWGRADDYCEQVLNQEPENARAYVIKLMARLKMKDERNLGEAPISFEDWNCYQKAYRYADDALRNRLEGYLASTKQRLERCEEERLRREQEELLETTRRRIALLYAEGCRLQKAVPEEKSLKEALQRFEKIPDYMDSRDRAKACKERLAELKEEWVQQACENERARRKERIKRGVTLGATLLVVVIVAMLIIGSVNRSRVQKESTIAQNLIGMQFKGEYSKLSDNETNDYEGMAEKWYEYEVTYSFQQDSLVSVYSFVRYDNYPFLLRDGVHQWDGTTETRDAARFDVQVSFFGKVTITINGNSYELKVDENDVPVSFVVNEVTYTAKR